MATVGMKDSIDILRTDAPVVELYTHMNKLYLWLEQNSQCFRGQDYSTITVIVTAFEEDADGNLDPDKKIESWSRVYQQYQIVERMEPDGFPPYNIWVQLKNYWYQLHLHFNFQYASPNGAQDFESKANVVTFDNRFTTLTNQESSQFFTGTLLDNLKRRNEMNVWFGTRPSTYQLWDLYASENGTMIKQITNIEGKPPHQVIQVLPAEENYMNLTKYIITHNYVPAIFRENFGDVSPDDQVFTFRLYLNQESYLINFYGNFQFLIDRQPEGRRIDVS